MDHPVAGSSPEDFFNSTTHTKRAGMPPLTGEFASAAQFKAGAQIEDVSFCAIPSEHPFTRRNSSQKESLGEILRQAIMDHQLGLSLNCILLIALTYAFFPSLRASVEPFFLLQYSLPSGLYAQGPQDVWIVCGLVVFFTALRAAALEYVLAPMAEMLGIKKRKARVRFAEQAYMLLYYSILWSCGVTILVKDTPPLTSTSIQGQTHDLILSLWRDFPKLELDLPMKMYYLAQTAFWVQQIIVIHVEERRKDHWQMLTHHFVTVGLLLFSYTGRQTRAGNAILVLMDAVDLVFPLAKMLKYLGLQTACDAAFGVFVITWVLTRHVAYNMILYAIIKHVGKTVAPWGTYSTTSPALINTDGGSNILDNLLQPLVNPAARTVQFNSRTLDVFIGLLGGLQVMTCVWFYMICRVVARVLRGQGADDSRSDDEDEEELEKEKESLDEESMDTATDASAVYQQHQKFIEVPAEAGELYYASSRPSSSARSGPSRKKSKGISSGLNLGEHKDLLNRIGCLSDEQLARERARRQESTSPRPSSSRRS